MDFILNWLKLTNMEIIFECEENEGNKLYINILDDGSITFQTISGSDCIGDSAVIIKDKTRVISKLTKE